MSQKFIHNRTWITSQMFKLRILQFYANKFAHLKFDAYYRPQNSWEWGHVYHGVVSPLLFKTV